MKKLLNKRNNKIPNHKKVSESRQNTTTGPLTEVVNRSIAGRMENPVLVIIVYSLVQLIRFGVHDNHYVFMIIGGAVSFVCIRMYTKMYTKNLSDAKRKELLAKPSMVVMYLYLFVFSGYIFLYQGFWGFLDLRYGFSIWIIIKSIAAIYLGREIAKTTADISEEVKNARKPQAIS